MKTNTKLLFLALVTTIFFISSCQQEVVEITTPEDNTTISVDSSVVNLVQRTSMRDGSGDNIIDNSSCTTLVLPITVIANGQEVIINTEDDFKLIERIFDDSDTDEDTVEMVFPITVILADHTEVIINNMDEFETLVADCVEGGADDDIECLDFVYPLTISVYDAANQVSEVITINNDEELYTLFESLEDDDLISFTFPLTLVLADGTEVEVNNNDELENLIEDVADTCDEDDDNDYEDDDVSDTNLVAVLLDGEWVITYFFDEVDSTTAFIDYAFNFNEDGSVNASKGDIDISGTWETYGDNGSLEIELNLGEDAPFDMLEEEWGVFDFAETRIELRNEEDTVATLVFEKL